MPDSTPCVTCDRTLPVGAGERVVRCPRCDTRTAVDNDDTPIRSRTARRRVPVHLLAAVGLIVLLATGVGVFAWRTLSGTGEGADPQGRVSTSSPTTGAPPPTTKPKPVTKPTRQQPPPEKPVEPPAPVEPEVAWRSPKLAHPPIQLRPEWVDANVADVATALKKLEDKPAVVTYPVGAARPEKPDPKTGYLKRTAHGFTLYVSEECHDQSDKRDGQPLACLESELQTIAERLPERLVKQLALVPIWVEWDQVVPGMPDVLAVYHHATSKASLALTGVNPLKNRCVTVMTLKTVFLAKSRDKLPTNVLAHELAHAVHDQCLGLDNPVVRNAFEQALTRHLYEDVRHADGRVGPAYALTNEAEYFAELSACFLDRVRYEPTDAAGLREYDSAGYELMTKVWGSEKAIEKAKKADAERKALLKK